ncbi:hypothetical protein [Conexibacter sp. SYSU D00693]|uniref:hypothetical protein n=1 Tax=Conexibacter sp. SYSU D00693 TaxID=2812560 RepID=UPI00196BB2B7|nr:hypothetical protein [Conexibacter sp. SYSU D00693]
MTLRASGRLVLATLTLAAAVPATAHAASAPYPSGTDDRSFVTSKGGWTDSVAYSVGVPGLTIPQVSNSFQATGGTLAVSQPGTTDGFLRVATGGLLSLAGTSTSVWTSPEFVYKGVGDSEEEAIALVLAQKADVGALLQLTGSAVTYSVDVLNAANQVVASGVKNQAIASSPTWRTVGPIWLDKNAIVLGQSYKLRVTTFFTSPAAVVPNATVDYDDVGLAAAKADPKPADPPAGQTPGGPAAPTQPLSLVEVKASGSTIGSARLTKKGLRVSVGCAAAARSACGVELTGYAKQGGAKWTSAKKGTVAQGARSKFVIALSKTGKKALKKASTITLRTKITIQGRAAVTYRVVRIVR